MSEVTMARLRAVAVVAPFIPLLGFIYLVGDVPEDPYDFEAVWAIYAADPERQWWARLLAAIWLGLSVVQIVAIRSYLRAAGDKLWSFFAVPLITMAYSLLIFMYADEAGMLVAVEAGASVEAVWNTRWNSGFGVNLFLVMLPFLSLGMVCFLVGLWRSHVLSRAMTWVVIFSAVARVGVGRVPLDWWVFQYGTPLLTALIFLPIAYQMWVDSAKPAVVGQTAAA